MTLTRLVSRKNPLLASLPDKFQVIHDYQVDAISEIVDYFDAGYKLVVLEAPTGSGKTLIAECVRRMLETRGCYVCHNKELQAQFAREYQYAKILYGRANYKPHKGLEDATCEDCTYTAEQDCDFCDNHQLCPYVVAKNNAIHSPVPILNSAYWLQETLGQRSRFANTGLCILDEAGTLENVLLGQVEVYIGEGMQRKYKITPPPKLTKDYEPWVDMALKRLETAINGLHHVYDLRGHRELRSLQSKYSLVLSMRQELAGGQPWVYTGGAGSSRRRGEVISFRPIKVSSFGQDRIWSKDKRFLLMDSYLPDNKVSSLGWTEPYKRVSVDSQFHPRNRQVVVRPVATMTRKGATPHEYARLRDGIQATLGVHRGDRCVIHCVSYDLRDKVVSCIPKDRPLFSYRGAGDRTRAIEGFKKEDAAILLAPGLERGLDLPDDLCRAQLILKVPYMNINDKQVAARLYAPGGDGKVWYNQHVATTVLQMVGRGVRSVNDYCTCYILDRTFIEWYRAWGHLFPEWFRRAIRIEV